MTMNYTQPITRTFELQRQSIEQGRQALEQTVEFNRRMAEAAVDSMDAQETMQRRAVELQQTAVHQALDAFEANTPGSESMTDDVRIAFDEQIESLLEVHEELFDNTSTELAEGVEAYDEMLTEYLDAVDEQIGMLLDTHEDIEAQSTEAVEQFGEQVDELQEQVEDVQQQMQDMSEQAADAVEA